MSESTKKEVYSGEYFALYDDMTMGISDGVGYIDTLDKTEIMQLYKALKLLIEGDLDVKTKL